MTNPVTQFPETYEHTEVETRIAALWEDARLYDYDPDSPNPVYSIDTPPPYVSAAHLHVGHAMSYAQAEFVVRYRRMRGYSIFYPMGFDDIAFAGEDGSDLIISTTRPELIPACVGLFFHPKDERYSRLRGKSAKAPIFGQPVPILESEEVDPEFGTGLMMVCTFGDAEDVRKWREHKLDTRIVLTG